MADQRQEVYIDYTNWKGQRSVRRIRPLALSFENNEWHPDTQWLLEAVDIANDETRTFALRNIHQWATEPIMPKGAAGDRGQVGWMGGEVGC